MLLMGCNCIDLVCVLCLFLVFAGVHNDAILCVVKGVVLYWEHGEGDITRAGNGLEGQE